MFTSKYKQDLYNDLSITIGDTVVDCKYGSRSFVRASVNLWNSLMGERAAWL